jgi:hypothetical protein
LLSQLKKPLTPEIPKFLGEMGQNRRKIHLDPFWGTKQTLADSQMIFSAFLGH